MTTRSKTRSAEIEPHKRAVIYARVSSKEQEKEGYSIPAQLKRKRCGVPTFLSIR